MKQGEGGDFSLLFLDPKKIREILKEASETLLLSVSDELIEETAVFIESMKDDLVQLYRLPLHNSPIFHSHESFGLGELDEIYEKLEFSQGVSSLNTKTLD